ncbi:MAG: hypothetical protein ACXV7G_06705 [Halobacteriota archaeon]
MTDDEGPKDPAPPRKPRPGWDATPPPPHYEDLGLKPPSDMQIFDNVPAKRKKVE